MIISGSQTHCTSKSKIKLKGRSLGIFNDKIITIPSNAKVVLENASDRVVFYWKLLVMLRGCYIHNKKGLQVTLQALN